MTVYVLNYEVPYELGYPLGVYSTREFVDAARARATEPYETRHTDAHGFEYVTMIRRNPENLRIYAYVLDAEPEAP